MICDKCLREIPDRHFETEDGEILCEDCYNEIKDIKEAWVI